MAPVKETAVVNVNVGGIATSCRCGRVACSFAQTITCAPFLLLASL